MARGVPLVTDRQWTKIEPLLPRMCPGSRGGRPWADSRLVLEGILWIARNGARWKDLPAEYPSPSTCWRRLRDWEEQDVWLTIWRTFLGELNRRGRLDWSEAFMVGVDGKGLPLGVHLGSASPAEVTLAEPTLAAVRVPNRYGRGRPRQKPQRLIADKAYDSDPLRRRLNKRGIDLIVPHKKNRVRKPTQDGRKLRRYRKRWKIERTNAWLGNFRRLVVRYERYLHIYQAFFHIACFMIVLRRL
jgi:transposase